MNWRASWKSGRTGCRTRPRPEGARVSDSRSFLGAVIILFGLFFLLREFIPWFTVDNDVILPLLVIGIGFYIILKK